MESNADNIELRKPHKHTLKVFLVGEHKRIHDLEERNGSTLKEILEGLYSYELDKDISFNESTVINGNYITSLLKYKGEVIKVRYSISNKEVFILENSSQLSDLSIKEEIMIAITVKELRF